jgi:hypothetical protein
MTVLASAQPSAGPDALVAPLTTSNTIVKDRRNKVTKPRLDLAAALAIAVAPAPTGQVVIGGGAKYTKSTAATVDVATTSGKATQVCLSGLDLHRFEDLHDLDGVAAITLDTTAPSNGTLSYTATLPTGRAYVRLCAVDNAGNIKRRVTLSAKTTGK